MRYRIYNYKTREYVNPEEFVVSQDGEVLYRSRGNEYLPADDQERFVVELCLERKSEEGRTIYAGDRVTYEFNGQIYHNKIVSFCPLKKAFSVGTNYFADSFNLLSGVNQGIKNIRITGNVHEIN